MIFKLNITPTAQARVRHGIKNGFVTAFKSSQQFANERTLEACLLEHKPKKPLTGAIAVRFTAFLPAPASVSIKKRTDMLLGLIKPTKKPDIDNLAKQLLDCMTRLQFWEDDKQIVELTCQKKYSDQGHWFVVVEEV